jgi:hypothetical protein
MAFDRSAYQEVVDDPKMTAPALFLGVSIILLTYFFRPDIELGWVVGFIQLAVWFLTVGAVTIVGRILSRQGSYTRTLRGLGFAHVVYLVEFVALIPALAPLAIALGTFLGFISYWMGAAAAHNTRGWRTIVLPFLAFIVAILIPILILMMLGSVVFSFQSVFEQLGFTPGNN